MKKICVITISYDVGKLYKKQLELLFGNNIRIDTISIEKSGIDSIGEYDIYLIATTSSDVFSLILTKIKDKSKIVIVQLTFLKTAIRELELVSETEALLVNLSEKMANETITNLYRLGINNIKFKPYYPGCTDEVLPLAITPGEKRYVPKSVKHVIDIGNRVLSINTISEIALRIDMVQVLNSELFTTYKKRLVEADFSISTLSSLNYNIENRYEVLLESIGLGIIATNVKDEIIVINTLAEKYTGLKKREIIGVYIKEIYSDFDTYLANSAVGMDLLVDGFQEKLTLRIEPISKEGEFFGHYLIYEKYLETEERQVKLRKQLKKRQYSTKYYFDDIKTVDEKMNQAKLAASKMAPTDLSILITGESGTGKELFAHSIHNASKRRLNPFVAINCAAIPENLLESELFGYVEGAFTGAIKGGKQGLFELAHKGTIFFDEIETMSMNLQSKLLRVLEEKEFMKIGDNKTIDIDVRIIAASNEDIYEKVKGKEFRKDLYYRLNTLPIEIPPLRERKKDIIYLIENIIQNIGARYIFSDATTEILMNHSWEGNVRELINLLEYLKFLDKKIIDPEDLPSTINKKVHDNDSFVEQKEMDQKSIFVLKQILKNPKGIGRNRIVINAKNHEILLTENEVRRIFKELSDMGYIEQNLGRRGTKINSKYIEQIRRIIGG